MSRLHKETHLVARIGWLRAAVLAPMMGSYQPPVLSWEWRRLPPPEAMFS